VWDYYLQDNLIENFIGLCTVLVNKSWYKVWRAEAVVPMLESNWKSHTGSLWRINF